MSVVFEKAEASGDEDEGDYNFMADAYDDGY